MRLPALVDDVARRFQIEVGAPFQPGGCASWVAPVRQRVDGSRAVLKVQFPNPESQPEAPVLAAWAGVGAVRLLDHDPDRRALLLEWCEPGTGLVEEGGSVAAATAGADIATRLHATPPPAGTPTLASVLGPWADEVEARLALHPTEVPGWGQRALATMRDRPGAVDDHVLLHGDLNPTNVLSAAREPWLAIDPKPMVGDPAYDGARLVLQPDPNATAHPAGTLAQRLDVLAQRMAVDRGALLEWCLVDAVQMAAEARAQRDLAQAQRLDAQVALIAAALSRAALS